MCSQRSRRQLQKDMYKEDGTNNKYLVDSSTGDNVNDSKSSSDSGKNVTESNDVEQASFSHTEDSSRDRFTKIFTNVSRANNMINKHNITTHMELVDSGNINNSSYNHTKGIGTGNMATKTKQVNFGNSHNASFYDNEDGASEHGTTNVKHVNGGNVHNASYNHTENGRPEHSATVANTSASDSKKKGEVQCYL